jgi:hypothetical protein
VKCHQNECHQWVTSQQKKNTFFYYSLLQITLVTIVKKRNKPNTLCEIKALSCEYKLFQVTGNTWGRFTKNHNKIKRNIFRETEASKGEYRFVLESWNSEFSL